MYISSNDRIGECLQNSIACHIRPGCINIMHYLLRRMPNLNDRVMPYQKPSDVLGSVIINGDFIVHDIERIKIIMLQPCHRGQLVARKVYCTFDKPGDARRRTQAVAGEVNRTYLIRHPKALIEAATG